MKELEGVLPLWKSVGMTSHDCVARARKLLRMKRIGHTGTLDPGVSGVLPLCVGRATRIVEYLQELPKTYEAELTIGYATDTEDADGMVTERANVVSITEDEIRKAVFAFVGDIEQTPPMYSAVKVGGKRLYELARAGIEVDRSARTVSIYSIELTELMLEGPYPKVRMTVTCSKGTYIRTLCTDIGRALGYPAVMSGLVRTGSGSIRREQCLTFDDAELLALEGNLSSRIIPIGDALAHLPKGRLSDAAVLPALQGKKLYFPAVRLETDTMPEGFYRLYGSERDAGSERFIGVYRIDKELEVFVPVKLFT